jgi:uncharacterized protein
MRTAPAPAPMSTARTISMDTARRMAVAAQRLDGPPKEKGKASIMDCIRQVRCLQLDPTSAVARSHQLVVRSRLGNYDTSHLDDLCYSDRELFEYWAHAASIVLTQDYPVHRGLMTSYLKGDSAWEERIRGWVESNDGLRRTILRRLRREGPLPSRVLSDISKQSWRSTGWTAGRNVSRMLDILWAQGKIMVSARSGGQKLWDLAERVIPDDARKQRLSNGQRTKRAALSSLRALGVGTEQDIRNHFIRGRYPQLRRVLASLENDGEVERIRVHGSTADWFVRAADTALQDRIESDHHRGMTTLLSPFDNLICDRSRTERLFDFHYRIEIYVPKDKRRYGYFAMPVLHGDELIGRVDPLFDRKSHTLRINSVHAEPGRRKSSADDGAAVATAIGELAGFLGATSIEIGREAPPGWRRAVRGL